MLDIFREVDEFYRVHYLVFISHNICAIKPIAFAVLGSRDVPDACIEVDAAHAVGWFDVIAGSHLVKVLTFCMVVTARSSEYLADLAGNPSLC